MKSNLCWYGLFLAIVMVSLGCKKNKKPLPDINKVYALSKSELDIAYGIHPKQKMDIYFPEGYNIKTPVIFYVHGGGFIAGSKEEVSSVAKLFMTKGFVVVNIGYRLVDVTGLFLKPPLHLKSDVKVADQVADMNEAVRKYMNIASTHGVGTTKMYMAGHSAGGTLAMLFVQGDKNKDKVVRASGNLAGPTNLTVSEELLNNPPHDSIWLPAKELMYRFTGAEVSKSNMLFLMAISPDWVSLNQGGRPNITIMPKSNNDDIGVANFKNTITEAQQYDRQLRDRGVNSSFILMDTDHGFGNHPDDKEKAVNYTVSFFLQN